MRSLLIKPVSFEERGKWIPNTLVSLRFKFFFDTR